MAKTDMQSTSGQQQRPQQQKPKQKPRKAKVHVPPPDAANPSLPAIPQAMIFRRGRVAHSVLSLVSDLRLLFSPHSSLRLQERKTNTMKDFLSVAPQLGVSHFLCFTQSEVGVNMRVIRIPQGPTVTFRVVGYSLMRDVVNAQKRPHSPASEYLHPPLVVLNNFSAAAAASAATSTTTGRTSSDVSTHLPLLSTILQHMFPSLHLPTLVLSHCRRVVLFHYDPTTQLIELRHYLITASPANLSRAMRRLVRGKLTDMSKYDDIADYVKAMEAGTAATAGSESEGEVAEDSKVTLGDRYIGKGNVRGGKSGVRLKELGPRITLSTLKIEEEFCGGTVLYHHYLSRSDEEVAELKAAKEAQRRDRARRRAEQERNVKRKMGEDGDEDDDEDEHERQTRAAAGDMDDDDGYTMDVEEEEGNDDERYFEEAVGEKPSKELFGKGDESHGAADSRPPKKSRRGREGDDEGDEEKAAKVGKFKKRRIEAAKEKEEQRRQVEEKSEDGEAKKKRTGGRRVGAGPRKPWIRGRGGKLESSRGAGGGGRGGRGGGGERGRGGGGRGGGRGGGGGGRGRGRGRGGR